MDSGTLILIFIGMIVVVVVVDLLLTGGAMIMGTMHGIATMASHPAGWAILLVLLAILGMLVYTLFFR